MKIIVTMAGEGSRFKKTGYNIPKYEITVEGKTLFEWSILSLKNFFKYEFVFVVRSDFNGQDFVNKMATELGINNFKIVKLDALTSGQAETVYQALKGENDDSILICNIDTAFQPRALNPERINAKYWWVTSDLDGNNWSFAEMDKESKLIKTTEKVKISSYASTGIYFFHSSNEFLDIYQKFSNDVKSKWKETYIAPFYNYINREDFDILHLSKNYIFCLGTPEEVEINKKRLSEFDNYTDVTMVVTQYNGWKYLDNIIDKFEKQNGNFTKNLIIVNNGSEEVCPIAISNRLNKNITMINKDYGNIGFGRQVAIDNALGNYITIVDVDDSFEDEYLNKMFEQSLKTKAELVNAVKVNYNFEKQQVIKKTTFSKKGRIVSPHAFPHNRLFKRDLLANLIVSKNSSIDDLSFIPVAIARAKSITESDAEYYWRTDLLISASRGYRQTRMDLYTMWSLAALSKFNNLRYVKFVIAWELIQLEYKQTGSIRISKIKLKMFRPFSADGFYCNFIIILRRMGILKIILFFRDIFKKR